MIYIFVDVGGYWQELSGPAAIYSRYYPKPFEHKLPVHVVERAYMGGWVDVKRKEEEQQQHYLIVLTF